jgi:hypothetical protein
MATSSSSFSTGGGGGRAGSRRTSLSSLAPRQLIESSALDVSSSSSSSPMNEDISPLANDELVSGSRGGDTSRASAGASIENASAELRMFTQSIVTADPVVKPHVYRVDKSAGLQPSLRRRRGLMPLKIVHPEAILRAVFAPHRQQGVGAGANGVDLSAMHYM